MVLEERVAHRLWDIFLEIAECYGYEIAMQEVMLTRVPIFLSVSPPLYSCQSGQTLRSLSARRIFHEFPEVKRP